MPDPDAPMMVTTSPGMTSRSMLRSTSWLPNDLRRPSTRTRGSVAEVQPVAGALPAETAPAGVPETTEVTVLSEVMSYSSSSAAAWPSAVTWLDDELMTGPLLTSKRAANLPSSHDAMRTSTR